MLEAHGICTKERPDRQKALLQAIQPLIGLTLVPHTFTVDAGDKVRGCRNSHLSLYQFAKDKDLPYILVLEDNIVIPDHNTANRTLETLGDLLTSGRLECDVLLLCAFFIPFFHTWKKTSHPDVLDVSGKVMGSSAYVIFRDCYNRILAEDSHAEPIDITLARQKVYLVTPLIFHHSHVTVSLANRWQDVMRWFWFRPDVYHWCERNFINGTALRAHTIFFGFVVLSFIVIAVCLSKAILE